MAPQCFGSGGTILGKTLGPTRPGKGEELPWPASPEQLTPCCSLSTSPPSHLAKTRMVSEHWLRGGSAHKGCLPLESWAPGPCLPSLHAHGQLDYPLSLPGLPSPQGRDAEAQDRHLALLPPHSSHQALSRWVLTDPFFFPVPYLPTISDLFRPLLSLAFWIVPDSVFGIQAR